jgi:hypothetical protein
MGDPSRASLPVRSLHNGSLLTRMERSFIATLTQQQIPPISAEWVGAVYAPEAAHTPQQKELLSLSDSSACRT